MTLQHLEERFSSLEKGLEAIRTLLSNQPSQRKSLPRARSRQPTHTSTTRDWETSVNDALESLSRDILDLKHIVNSEKSLNDTNSSIHTELPELRLTETCSLSSESFDAVDDGDTESSTCGTNLTEQFEEDGVTRPKPSPFHLSQEDMGRNLIQTIMQYYRDSRFDGKLTVEVPLVPWHQILQDLPSISGEDRQLGVRFTTGEGFASVRAATPTHKALRTIPEPLKDDVACRQGLEEFLDGLIKDPPKTAIPYYVGPAPYYQTILSAGVHLEKLPELAGVNQHYIHLGDRNSGTAFHREDGGLRSCNLTIYGVKVWILIRPDSNIKFEKLVRTLASTNGCAQFVRHTSIFIPPKALRKHSIEFDITCTGPGEMIVTSPGQYHAVINRTSCLAISINFTLPDDDPGLNGLRVCPECGLYTLNSPGIALVKVARRVTMNGTSGDDQATASHKRKAEDDTGSLSQPRQNNSVTIFALKREEQQALQQDRRCSIPEYDVKSPPSPEVFKLVLALRGRATVQQLCGLINEKRKFDIKHDVASTIDRDELDNEQLATKQLFDSAKLLAQAISMGHMGGVKKRLAQIDYFRAYQVATGTRQRISSAEKKFISDVTGLTRDQLTYHTDQGSLWAMLCDELPGLLCLIPFHRRKSGEQSSRKDYISLSGADQEVLRNLMNDDYGKVLCGAAAAFLRSMETGAADVEFRFENDSDISMDMCDKQSLLRSLEEFPYIDENVWVLDQNWQRPTYWPEAWPWPADPTHIPYGLDHLTCGGTNCDCMGELATSKPRIRLYGEKGRGLQAVASVPGTVAYRKGITLGELTGQIFPPGTYDDHWTLDFVRPDLPDEPVVCQIRSADMGSCFRLLNTSLEPCAKLQSRRRGDKYVTAVVALRDIMDQEEITVSYGQSKRMMEEASFIL